MPIYLRCSTVLLKVDLVCVGYLPVKLSRTFFGSTKLSSAIIAVKRLVQDWLLDIVLRYKSQH